MANMEITGSEYRRRNNDRGGYGGDRGGYGGSERGGKSEGSGSYRGKKKKGGFQNFVSEFRDTKVDKTMKTVASFMKSQHIQAQAEKMVTKTSGDTVSVVKSLFGNMTYDSLKRLGDTDAVLAATNARGKVHVYARTTILTKLRPEDYNKVTTKLQPTPLYYLHPSATRDPEVFVGMDYQAAHEKSTNPRYYLRKAADDFIKTIKVDAAFKAYTTTKSSLPKSERQTFAKMLYDEFPEPDEESGKVHYTRFMTALRRDMALPDDLEGLASVLEILLAMRREGQAVGWRVPRAYINNIDQEFRCNFVDEDGVPYSTTGTIVNLDSLSLSAVDDDLARVVKELLAMEVKSAYPSSADSFYMYKGLIVTGSPDSKVTVLTKKLEAIGDLGPDQFDLLKQNKYTELAEAVKASAPLANAIVNAGRALKFQVVAPTP